MTERVHVAPPHVDLHDNGALLDGELRVRIFTFHIRDNTSELTAVNRKTGRLNALRGGFFS
jgi:hypothetical protein